MDKNQKIAIEVLKRIGGKENINSVFHCATRLRLELKDLDKVREDELKNTEGVLGIKKIGSSFQTIIGPNVGKVYDYLCQEAGLIKEASINENLDEELTKEKITVKGVFNSAISYVMNSMAPIIPVLIGVSIWKTVGALLGPGMLNVISDTSDFYIMCNFLFEALFYFLPVYIGYTAAKKMNVDPVWGIFLGALIITPSFMAMAGVRETFAVFGVPVQVGSYSQQFLPVIIGVWILKYVLKLLNKIIPTNISSLVIPILTVAIMTVIMFGICAPIGSYVGQIFSNVFMYFGNAAMPVKILTMGVLTALIPIMILFGMHVAIYIAALTAGTALGFESFFFPCMIIASFVLYGMSLGAIFVSKKDRGAVAEYFVAGFVAGITEPSLYGVCMKSQKSIQVMTASCFVGGLLAGIFNLKCSLLASVSILSLVPFFTVDSTFNMAAGIIITLGTALLAAAGVILYSKYEE